MWARSFPIAPITASDHRGGSGGRDSVWGLTATAKFPFAGLRAASSICRDDLPEPLLAPKFKGGRAADSSGWKMFGVPIGLEIGSDLGIDDEDAGRTVPDPAAQGVEIVHGAHGRRATAIAARDGRKIGVGKLDDVDAVALPAVEMHLGGVRTVIVDENADAQLEAHRRFEIGARHQKAA